MIITNAKVPYMDVFFTRFIFTGKMGKLDKKYFYEIPKITESLFKSICDLSNIKIIKEF